MFEKNNFIQQKPCRNIKQKHVNTVIIIIVHNYYSCLTVEVFVDFTNCKSISTTSNNIDTYYLVHSKNLLIENGCFLVAEFVVRHMSFSQGQFSQLPQNFCTSVQKFQLQLNHTKSTNTKVQNLVNTYSKNNNAFSGT